MRKKTKRAFALAILAIGIILLRVHLGIFVFIYLPVCLILGLITLVQWLRRRGKPLQEPEEPEPEPVIEIAKYPKRRKTFGAVLMLTIFLITPLLLHFFPSFPTDYSGDGPPAIFSFVIAFINPEWGLFLYPGIIIGLHFLISKRIRRAIGVILLLIAGPMQLLLGLANIVHLLEGYSMFIPIIPLSAVVPFSLIYSVFEPAVKLANEQKQKENTTSS